MSNICLRAAEVTVGLDSDGVLRKIALRFGDPSPAKAGEGLGEGSLLGGLAQLVRAGVSYAPGPGFESLSRHRGKGR